MTISVTRFVRIVYFLRVITCITYIRSSPFFPLVEQAKVKLLTLDLRSRDRHFNAFLCPWSVSERLRQIWGLIGLSVNSCLWDGVAKEAVD